MAATQIGKQQQRAATNREAFPGVASISDEFSAVFGPVKILHGIENGKEIGKPQPFDGTDVDKYLRHIDMADKRKGAK